MTLFSAQQFVLTIDVDWAPDFMIDFVAERLISANVKSTWFVTHKSPALERMAARKDLFELGIHPNFLPGSTHGNTEDEVLRHCLDLVPDATCVRMHGLVQSTHLLDKIADLEQLQIDASLFLPRATHLEPIDYRAGGTPLLRIPYCWEDDFEMRYPEGHWRLEQVAALGVGLRIFDFHPVHVFLNGTTPERYNAVKVRAGGLANARWQDTKPFLRDGLGPRSLFDEIVGVLRDSGEGSTLRQIGAAYEEHRDGVLRV